MEALEPLVRKVGGAVAAWSVDPPWWVVAALALAVVALAVRYLKRALPKLAESREGLTAAHLAITGAVALAAVALVGFAFAMSYASLYASATWLQSTPFGDLRWMFPIGIDAVIVYFLVLDLVMEWQGRPHPLARWSAYGLSAVTIALNVAQTGPDEGLAGALGHAGPPVVIVLISEAVAAWVRHMAGMLHGDLPDRIPAGRWIAQPVSTLLVARLMLGWGVTSYETALRLESARQYARSMLRQEYGRAWRSRTPRHVLWMLANGRDLPTALRLVDALTPSVPKTAEQARRLAGPPRDASEPGASPERDTAPEPEDGWSVGEVLAAELGEYLRACDVSGWDAPGDTVASGPSPTGRPGDTGPVDGDAPTAAEEAAPADEADLPWWHTALPEGGTPGDQQGHPDGTVRDAEGDTRERIREVLSREPRISVRRMAEVVGCSRSQAHRLMKEVREETERGTARDAASRGRPEGGGEGDV